MPVTLASRRGADETEPNASDVSCATVSPTPCLTKIGGAFSQNLAETSKGSDLSAEALGARANSTRDRASAPSVGVGVSGGRYDCVVLGRVTETVGVGMGDSLADDVGATATGTRAMTSATIRGIRRFIGSPGLLPDVNAH